MPTRSPPSPPSRRSGRITTIDAITPAVTCHKADAAGVLLQLVCSHLFKLGFIYMFAFTYFSFSSERKVPKEAPFKRKPTVSLENPFPYMVAHAVQKHRVNCAQGDLYQDSRVVGKCADQLGQSRQACSGQGFLRRLAYLDLAFPKREITVFFLLVRTPSRLARSLRDRVGCHAWQQLGRLGVGHLGRNQRGA